MVQSLDDARRRRPTQGGPGRVPPHDLQAEESLLGAMLLSKDAVSAAVEICRTDQFYKPAHGHIYDAIVSLYAAAEPVDPVTVADELRRADLLDAIGGPAVLVAMQANTPATSNAARYARIVEEHALLRRLIGVAGEIAEMGYALPEDVEATLDRAETLVFEVAERKSQNTTRQLSELLGAALDRIGELYERGESITGVPTGYTDLDERLSGLQRSSLVIVGARPAMGKTSFALGMAAHAAMEGQVPVLFFSLEMGHTELTQRLLCAEARVDSTRVRTGKLQESDWSKISHAIGRLGEAKLHIDDNPHLTIMDIRAKARRLKAQHADLGLIVIDYLQLMTGRSGAESRQLEVSEISRGLKILARELEVPVVALSQLTRGLEQRADKRPMLSDLRESGCMPASTRLYRADGTAVTLGELVLSQEQPLVWSLDDRFRLVARRLLKTFPSGIKPAFRLKLASGLEVDATANHPFRTVDGWARLDELQPGSFIAVPRRLPEPAVEAERLDRDELVLLAHLLGDGSMGPSSVKYSTADPANKAAVEEAASRRFGISVEGKQLGRTWQLWFPSPYRLTHGRHHPMRNWLEPLGLWGSRSHDKFVPEAVHALGDDQIATFLHHLWATDGSITITRNARGSLVNVYYASTSRRLADDVRRLLLRLGITTRLHRARKNGYRDSWHLRVYGAENLERFLTRVGCHGERGDVIPTALSIVRGLRGNPNVDLVPWEVAHRVKAAMATAGVTHRELAGALGEHYCGSYLLGSETRPRRFSRDRLGRMADVVDDAALRDLATSDVLWDEVVEIVSLGEMPTFDATVEDTHNFIADGVIAHNSLEQDADVVMFIYRDEIYNNESQDRGTAEVIVAKHRNGPTGTARLAFLDHYTKFANMTRNA